MSLITITRLSTHSPLPPILHIYLRHPALLRVYYTFMSPITVIRLPTYSCHPSLFHIIISCRHTHLSHHYHTVHCISHPSLFHITISCRHTHLSHHYHTVHCISHPSLFHITISCRHTHLSHHYHTVHCISITHSSPETFTSPSLLVLHIYIHAYLHIHTDLTSLFSYCVLVLHIYLCTHIHNTTVLTIMYLVINQHTHLPSLQHILVILPRVQVAGYSYTPMHLRYTVALHEVTWCMIASCTQNMPRRKQFHVALAMSAL